MELAVWLLFSTLVIQLLDWVGTDSLANLLYTPFAPASKANKDKKAQILALRAELAATSSQDEFSKWARIRRKLDKAVADLESTTADSSAHRKAFATKFKSALWILTTVVPFIISSYHRKSPVFWLPRGWFGPLGWWLSLPSAPAGALAVSLWTMSIKRTLVAVKTAAVELVLSPAEKSAQQFAAEQEKQKVKVAAASSGAEKETAREKKEL
ncbi:hypothetical protein JCM8097_003558 [Rhodosporidiobolus ruineniae]